MARWDKDPALILLCYWFDPSWPGNFLTPWVWPPQKRSFDWLPNSKCLFLPSFLSSYLSSFFPSILPSLELENSALETAVSWNWMWKGQGLWFRENSHGICYFGLINRPAENKCTVGRRKALREIMLIAWAQAVCQVREEIPLSHSYRDMSCSSLEVFPPHFWPPLGIWSSQGRDHIWATVVTYTTAAATWDLQHTVLGRGLNLLPSAAELPPPILLRHRVNSCFSEFWRTLAPKIISNIHSQVRAMPGHLGAMYLSPVPAEVSGTPSTFAFP